MKNGQVRNGQKCGIRGGPLICIGIAGLILYTFKSILLILAIVLIVLGILTLS